MPSANGFEIGVDIGGTFTDVVCRDSRGGLRLAKIPTTRADPSAGVRQALLHMAREWRVDAAAITRFVHGTTMATNAVLERKGAKLGLITTGGFRDVLEIGRQNRRDMYDLRLKPQTPVFLAPGALRKEVPERISAQGEVVVPLDTAAVRAAAVELAAQGVQAIAISFLFSFLDPRHEIEARAIIAALYPQIMVSISSEVDPAFREYERTCVTAFDAYLKPVVDRYLAAMERDLTHSGVDAPLQIMQSRGGVASSAAARSRPVRLFLSGPAAGVIGASQTALSAGFADVITIDIGGTSSDIALVSGAKPLIAPEGRIDGYAVRVSMVDVNAIGAGGGSIAWLDGAGTLKVGPSSAGSEPGPACYGRGGEQPTVTDASVALGYIDPEYFAGGTLELHAQRAWETIERSIARPMAIGVQQAALGIHRVVNANMAEGIRLISVGRGIDPRKFTLLPLGGAGPLHATALARELGIRRIVVPLNPGVLSAAGLLAAPVEHEIACAYARPLAALALDEVRQTFATLDRRCMQLMAAEGVAQSAVRAAHFADVCYIGQSYHLEIPLALDAADPIAKLRQDFLAAHDRVYGHSTDAPATTVNLRTIHQADAGPGADACAYVPSAGSARKADRRIVVAAGAFDAAVFERSALAPNFRIDGPAIVEQIDTTTLIEPGWRATVAPNGNLLLETLP